MILKYYTPNKNLRGAIADYLSLRLTKELELLLDMTIVVEVNTQKYGEELQCEGYIEVPDLERRFVIKEIEASTDGITTITGVLDLEFLQRWEQCYVNSGSLTIENFVRTWYAGDRESYAIDVSKLSDTNKTKKRTISTDTNADGIDFFKMALRAHRLECDVNAYKNRITFYNAGGMGNVRGVHVMEGLNMKNMRIKSNSYDFCSELEYQGMDGSTSAKFGMETNHTYTSKCIRKRWIDDRYTDRAEMKTDCAARLKDLSKPYTSYQIDIVDLASISADYAANMVYDIGDTVMLVNPIYHTVEKQRIVQMEVYPNTPEENKVTLANKILTFDEKSELYRLD